MKISGSAGNQLGVALLLAPLSARSYNTVHAVQATPSPKCSASPRTSPTPRTLGEIVDGCK